MLNKHDEQSITILNKNRPSRYNNRYIKGLLPRQSEQARARPQSQLTAQQASPASFCHGNYSQGSAPQVTAV